MSLANAARELGRDEVVMKSYWNFQSKKFSWFFSPNPGLKSATKKPKQLIDWNDWEGSSTKQKMTLASLSGFKQDATDIRRSDSDFAKLKIGYAKWRYNLYSVFWGVEQTATCNIFVGDAIYLATKKSVVASNQHYYDPRQIKAGSGQFKERNSIEEVQVGDIVVMLGGRHVEIITRLKDYWFADKGFCSYGAGRGNSAEIGIEKCDVNFKFDENRELNNAENSFHYL